MKVRTCHYSYCKPCFQISAGRDDKKTSVSINLHFPETALLWHFKNIVFYKHSETFFSKLMPIIMKSLYMLLLFEVCVNVKIKAMAKATCSQTSLVSPWCPSFLCLVCKMPSHLPILTLMERKIKGICMYSNNQNHVYQDSQLILLSIY